MPVIGEGEAEPEEKGLAVLEIVLLSLAPSSRGDMLCGGVGVVDPVRELYSEDSLSREPSLPPAIFCGESFPVVPGVN